MRLPRSISRALLPFVGRVPVPVLSGVNRGQLWSLASAGSGYATGRRSAHQMQLFASLVKPGDCVWDVGAHHGYMSLCAAQRVGPTGRVYAFEPSAMNRGLLTRHLMWNRAANAEALPFALSDFEGHTTFGGSGTSKMLALGGGDEVVTVTRGAALMDTQRCVAPTLMKIDVEGAEGSTLRGMGMGLPPTARIMAAMHSADAYTESANVLRGLGFRLYASPELHACLTDGVWRSDPDLLAIGPSCAVADVALCLHSYIPLT